MLGAHFHKDLKDDEVRVRGVDDDDGCGHGVLERIRTFDGPRETFFIGELELENPVLDAPLLDLEKNVVVVHFFSSLRDQPFR
jgi:hypothetical protein